MRYIEIVGLDGAGKTHLSKSLVCLLGSRARRIHISQADITRRAASLVTTCDKVSSTTRILTYMAAHSEAFDRATLDNIDFLVGDRGYACFYAYQYQAGSDVIDNLWSLAMRNHFPDLLVFLDTPVRECQERIARRKHASEMDTRPIDFQKAVRERYLAFMDNYEKGKTLILDGSQQTDDLSLIVSKTLTSIPTLQSILPTDTGGN